MGQRLVHRIAVNGWSQPAFAFFPLYPTLMRYIGLLSGDPVLAGFLISNILGIAWIPLFQSIAEQYMSRREASACTLIAATFPYVTLFGSVVYTEALFLFSTILAWFLYRRGKPLEASLAAGAATLTKTYGIAILLPMVADAIFQRRWRRLFVGLIPTVFFASWMVYQYMLTGDAFAFLAAQQQQWGKQKSIWWLISPILTEQPAEYLQRNNGWYMSYYGTWSCVPYILVLVLFFGILTLRVWEIDWRLALYSTSHITLFIVAPMESLARFFSFIFPLWLTVTVRNRASLYLLLVFFVIFSVVLWYQFIMGWVV